jgi:hypothetical protein
MVQFPPTALNYLIYSLFWFIGLILLIVLYRRNRIKACFSILIAFFFMVFNGLFLSLAYIFQLNVFLAMSVLSFQFAFIFESRFFDLIWYDRLGTTRTGIVMATFSLNLYLICNPSSYTTLIQEGYEIPKFTPVVTIFVLIPMGIALLFAFHWLIICHKKAPPRFATKLRRIIYATLIMGPLGLIALFIWRNYIICTIIEDSGTILWVLMLLKDPQILYILPFSVDRLIVIDKESGLPIFCYDWVSSQIQDILIGGLLQALQQISFEALEKGFINEIKLDKGVLLIQDGEKSIAGLVSSKSSNFLHGSLKNFLSDFEKKFCGEKYDPTHADKFSEANQLIKTYFGNIPLRIDE